MLAKREAVIESSGFVSVGLAFLWRVVLGCPFFLDAMAQRTALGGEFCYNYGLQAMWGSTPGHAVGAGGVVECHSVYFEAKELVHD